MTEHYTRATVEASAWCKVCHAETMHRVHDRQLQACIRCGERQTREAAARPKKEPPKQLEMFRME
jgi:hypothetical protein